MQREITRELVQKMLPKRSANTNKGSYGSVLAAAGSLAYRGAAALCTSACLRVGCGIATLAVPDSQQPILAAKLTEAMTVPVPEVQAGVLGGDEALKLLVPLTEGYDTVLIGPGLGRARVTGELVRALVRETDRPLVLDADGIYALRDNPEILREAKHVPILTPHLGEMAGLLGLSVEDLREDIVGIARDAAAEYHAVFVLKSECTLVAFPDGRVFFTTKGNAGMATAGAGDVLVGTIAGLMEQAADGMAPVLGVYLHGLAGDLAYGERAEGLIAGDILAKLPEARRLLQAGE